MASLTRFEVYDPDGNLQATVREEAAAIKLADWYGNCSTIRVDGRVVWTAVIDSVDALGSYEAAAELMAARSKGLRR